jgi:hypothetical protein
MKDVDIRYLLGEYRNLLTEKAKREISEDKLIQFMDYLCPYWFDTEKNLEEKLSKNDPDSYYFEREIWNLGERIRQCLAERKTTRNKSVLLDKAGKVLNTKEYRSGRVSFTFLFRDYADVSYSYVFKNVLFDSNVQLQLCCIDAINKMKVPDLMDDVILVMENTPYNWLKKECQKYLKNSQKYLKSTK